MTISEEKRQDYNRSIVLIMIALFSSAWVMINAGNLIISGILYIVILAISVFLYFVWDKF